MARWAGVQNESRPMDRCQEMSHWTPTMTLVDAKATASSGQGTTDAAVDDAAAGIAARAVGDGAAGANGDMCPAYRSAVNRGKLPRRASEGRRRSCSFPLRLPRLNRNVRETARIVG